MNIVPDDSEVGTTVINAQTSAATNVEPLDIYVIANVIPDGRGPFLG